MRIPILILACLLLVAPIIAQHRRAETKKEPNDPLGETVKKLKKSSKPKSNNDPNLVPANADEILFDRYDDVVLAARTGWRLIEGSDRVSDWFYYDPSRVTTVGGNFKRAWIRMEKRKDGDVLAHLLKLNEYDCAQKRERTLQITGYGKDGQLLGSQKGDEVWEYVIPDTVGERVHGVICLNWPDRDELDMELAAQWFGDARRYEKQRNLTQALFWYKAALEHAPENKKILAGIKRVSVRERTDSPP